MPSTKRSGHILVVDDEFELMQALCEALVDKGFEAVGFTEPAAALDALRNGKFDLLLSDLMMPGIDGIQLVREAQEIDPALIGIIMTGQGSVATAVEAMKAGAFDYILKPFRLHQVLRVLDRAMELRRLRAENIRLRSDIERMKAERVRELEEANARLAALATTDPLTGLANRRAFDEALAREVALSVRGGRPLSLVVVDIDHFKGFNDSFGHPAGDEVLRGIKKCLQESCRATDVAARIGGEEFGLILPSTDAKGAWAMAERVRHSVEAAHWPLRQVTISAGVATLDEDCGPISPEKLFEQADRALYRAKQQGRNLVVAVETTVEHLGS